jgi:2-C-methyl-D-erythritol 4-phosphate cytidylyltransferase
MQADRPKQYLTIGNKTILEHTLDLLISHPAISRVIVAISKEDPYFNQLSLAKAPWLTRVEGGATRAESVTNALQTLSPNDWALVHDAARPCVDHKDINNLIALTASTEYSGGLLATPVRDTMKRASQDAPTTVATTEDRDHLWHALTPQLFQAGALLKAQIRALKDKVNVTDEASAMEHCNYKVALIESNPANIKITRPADLPLATFYLQAKK